MSAYVYTLVFAVVCYSLACILHVVYNYLIKSKPDVPYPGFCRESIIKDLLKEKEPVLPKEKLDRLARLLHKASNPQLVEILDERIKSRLSESEQEILDEVINN